ncbi:long-chain-fatty-acyl-CoA reductase [Pseudomonas prosekii]|uniref:long-chain-fatty-acyl-CoA reductase n=1 Tax=Pseudomonas prosekii TaxID=1148509 RepID=A0A3L8D1V2_9PSED|nr:aldehyde dehydrogenase family protein [Pseudomonas prosekii]RLU11114.1 long-chain-fatty-acyl-CoA reductase [Pseudomonas prosekii]RLU14595.1 long-chain-fatty-acyl-CoA reductase [Pseudomonas prosekii]
MFLINGNLQVELSLDSALKSLQDALPRLLMTPLDNDIVITAAADFARRLQAGELDLGLEEDQRLGLIDFCQPDALTAKLERELGVQPRSLRRISYIHSHFESWHPLGLVVHITPGNAPMLAFCAVLESLLAGNINWLRPSSSDNGLTARLLQALGDCDNSGRLGEFIAVLPVATADIGRLFTRADTVSGWGGETALKAIHQQLPAGCRWIDWGHRISFAYLTPDAAQPDALDALVDEVCRLDQQACSSPQWLLVDSDDPAVLHDMGSRLAEAFARRSTHWPALKPSEQEASEITTRCAMTRLEQSFAGQTGEVWSEAGWRVIWEHQRTLAPSPLFRTLLIKPVPQHLIAETLLPWRTVLQSCALICPAVQTAALVRRLVNAGVTRITPASSIHEGYAGEPHDGVYALARLSRRISVSLPAHVLSTHTNLDALPAPMQTAGFAIMDKAAFQAQTIDQSAQLYFRSGGSSGTPALAGFSYRDFDRQMRAAADGMFAVGLDPAHDRVMNLFYSGSLYGGFASCWTILQQLGATQLPMGAPQDDDYGEIARLIVQQGVNFLIGMPSTLHRLFLEEQSILRAYGGIRKVFLGGEHLSVASRRLMESCGVTTIRSAIYGSVDAGPLGHACAATADGVFHLLSDTQQLEIVQLEQDLPVQGEEVGRLLFTSRARQSQTVRRYEVGDTGRWVPGCCACGLTSPRFELLERHGHLLRIGTEFISPSQLAQNAGVPIQLVLDHTPDGRERLIVRTDADAQWIRKKLMADTSLAAAVNALMLSLEIITCAITQFERNNHSGKTPLVIDRRLQQ